MLREIRTSNAIQAIAQAFSSFPASHSTIKHERGRRYGSLSLDGNMDKEDLEKERYVA